MALTKSETVVLNKMSVLPPKQDMKPIKEPEKYKRQIVWLNVILMGLMHSLALYGVVLLSLLKVKLMTFIIGFILGALGGYGVTAGVHRLWTHRTYKAKLPLQIILLTLYSLAGQNSVYEWVRDHRVHHKFSETDADPHNSNRGFFFSHVGWLMQKRHPDVIIKGNQIDMSDITSNPLVMFHTKYHAVFRFGICYIMPYLIFVHVVGEDPVIAIVINIVRHAISLHVTWSVNSAAHLWGNKPYDKYIGPAENTIVALLSVGEGFHNYHHVFPWDYKAAELGSYKLNSTTAFIDLFAKIGWAYDLKSPSKELVLKTIERYGDGTHNHHQEISPESDTFKG